MELKQNLERYINVKPISSFTAQISAQFIRRLISFMYSSKEIITMMNPFIFPLMYIIIIQMVLDQFTKDPSIEKTVLNIAFPIL